ncbi:MAG: hypothetical protein E6I50_03840 [Chloroflexi bacterium]|nr:MAG: hypothetical protein E6I50_03840 [Chloroflexota bacterium]
MKLLVVGILVAALAVLLTVATLIGYQSDRSSIPDFAGTGIAARIDTFGALPKSIAIQNEQTGATTLTQVAADGTFAARLSPGRYRISMQGDSRTVTIAVPSGDCVDVILDYRIPGLVLRIPG